MAGTAYPARVVEFARRLFEDYGYTIPEVRESLSKRGYHPPRETVAYWCDSDYRRRKLERQRARMRRMRGGQPGRSAEHLGAFRLRRMTELRGAGLSMAAVAAVMNLDHDLDLSDDQVRRIFDGTTSTQSAHRLLRGEPMGRGRPPKRVAA